MSTLQVSAEDDIDAPPDRVYRIIADYSNHHPEIVPSALSDLVVEQGGVGAGTVIRYKAKIAGRTSETRQRVEEPEPGCVLKEHDLTREMVTTFTVTPSGNGARVRIATEIETDGLRGLVERWLLPRVLPQMYRDEIANIERYAREHSEI